jgi:hypothetical protein
MGRGDANTCGTLVAHSMVWAGGGILTVRLVVVLRWSESGTTPPPAPTATVDTSPVYTLPDFLKDYAISVTNFNAGSVALLAHLNAPTG